MADEASQGGSEPLRATTVVIEATDFVAQDAMDELGTAIQGLDAAAHAAGYHLELRVSRGPKARSEGSAYF